MTGGGILTLVAYGAQNVILSGNPQMTYFYKAFKRYTHFAMENIAIPLEGPNEVSYDTPIRLRAKIPRYGDLLSELYFVFRLPDIFSKNIPPTSGGRISQWEFQWVRYIGAAMIQNAAFFVGGQKIQEFDGSYLVSRALLDMDQDTFAKWRTLVGDNAELTNPSEGVYAGGTSGTGYPTVIANPTLPPGTPQTNRPSIFGQTIYVPLSFWFTDSPSQAVPLVGLQGHECEVQLTLAPLNTLYTVLDISGQRVSPDFRSNSTQTELETNNPLYASNSDTSPQIRNFLTDIGVTPPPLNSIFMNARLQGNFVYLPKDEQTIFAGRPLAYCMRQITPYPFPGLMNRQVVDLQTHNPITRLLVVQRRSDSVNRNDFVNFTNWVNYPNAPYQPTPGILAASQQSGTSGLLIPNAQRDIVRSLRVLCDGNEIQEARPSEFFNWLSTYQYVKGIGQDGLLLYSFQLDQNPIQPSGSINSSKIRVFQLELDVYPLPVNPNYTYNVTVYVENLNWFEVASGMGGLKYAL
jgi:hypothetical protein